MNIKEATIISAYTGISFGSSVNSALHLYIEEKLGHPLFTHELANEGLWSALKKASRQDFMDLIKKIEESK